MDASFAVELLREYPILLAAVALATRAARAYQTQLTWPEYVVAHRFKRGVLPVLDRLPVVGPAVLWISEKGGRDDAEYVTTIDASVREIVADLRRGGASLHLINSLKRRPGGHGDRLTAAHVVWTIEDEQVEAYAFENTNGTVDLYAHTETSTDDPLGHLTDPQTDGDAHGVVAEALAAN